ncbi:hypothetical protein EPJ70_07980 [Brachyspira aalborgi]|uniref:Transmembrane protein n=1 Tax=Brachyspira aalborgi TaxID=29522 RepID=A0A5C8F463_9SPIR|nr:hypothetical protein EPJ70_07980 [Brachyspira aalborgi]
MNSIQFNSIQFNSIQFNSIQFNSIQFNSIQSHNFKFYFFINSCTFINILCLLFRHLFFNLLFLYFNFSNSKISKIGKLHFYFQKCFLIKNLILGRRLCLKQQKEFLLTNQNYF